MPRKKAKKRKAKKKAGKPRHKKHEYLPVDLPCAFTDGQEVRVLHGIWEGEKGLFRGVHRNGHDDVRYAVHLHAGPNLLIVPGHVGKVGN